METSEDTRGYWIDSCPQGIISFMGNQTSYPDDSPLLNPGITCDINCDSFTDEICEAAVETGGENPQNYLWIIVVVVVLLFGGLIFICAIYLIVKSKRKNSFSPINEYDT